MNVKIVSARHILNRAVPSLHIFFNGAWLSFIALFFWAQPASYIASKVLAPLTQLIFFTYLGTSATGPGTADFYVIGNALQAATLNGLFGVTMTIGRERSEGSLIYLIGSPANRLVIFLGRAFFNVLDGMLSVVLSFVWGIALFGLDMSSANIPGLALTILITAISTCGLGLLLGSISLVSLNVIFLNNTLFFLLMVFSGANLPAERMPSWMHIIGAGLPLTRSIRSARLLVTGASLAEVWPLLLGEIAIGAIYTLLGFALFRWFELQSKRRATLEAF